MHYVDLSRTTEHGMVTYKGLPAPIICDFLSREASKKQYSEITTFQIGKIELVANTGTRTNSRGRSISADSRTLPFVGRSGLTACRRCVTFQRDSSLPAGVRIWLVAGFTDMRRGIDGLAALVQTGLSSNPFSGELFIFRGRRSDRVKLLWHDADGMCLLYKRLHRGRFVWTHASDGAVQLSAAQLTTLLEGIDWRRVHRGGTRDGDAPPPTLAA
jgi:transposase